MCTPELCKMFAYKHTEKIEYVKKISLTFKKNANFAGKYLEIY